MFLWQVKLSLLLETRACVALAQGLKTCATVCVCFFVLCNRHRFNRIPGAPPRDGLGVTYLPTTISSDAGYADLPLALLGAPVDIGALLKTRVTVSRGRTPGPRLVGPPSRDRTTCTLSA